MGLFGRKIPGLNEFFGAVIKTELSFRGLHAPHPGFDHSLPQKGRHPGIKRVKLVRFESFVAHKHLIPAVAGKGHGHMLFGQPGHKVQRQRGLIRQKAVRDPGNARKILLHILRLARDFIMLGPEIFGDSLRVRRLVIRGVVKADRKGFDHALFVFLHQGHERARVNAAA